MANRKTAKKKARLERQRQEQFQKMFGTSGVVNITVKPTPPTEYRPKSDNMPTICKKAEEKPWSLDDEIDKAFARRLGK